MRDLIKYLLDQIVSHHDDVQIESEQDGRRLTFRVKVHPDDLGAVIGRSGRTINAIRTLVSAAATQGGELSSCWVKLVDSEGRDKGAALEDADDEGLEADDEVAAGDDDEVDADADDDVVYDDEDVDDEEERPDRREDHPAGGAGA